jgi:hypothetical protein
VAGLDSAEAPSDPVFLAGEPSGRRLIMIDELDRLRQVKGLYDLLACYQEKAGADRQAWQDRVLEQAGVEPRDLVRFHGELLAYGWLEQNTGMAEAPRVGAAPCCYRITPAGIRALRQAREEVAV